MYSQGTWLPQALTLLLQKVYVAKIYVNAPYDLCVYP